MNRIGIREDDPIRRVAPRAWLLTALVAALMAVTFWPTLGWMVERWLLPDSYYSHGFFVPLVALYFLWRDRHALLSGPVERSWLGLAMMVAGIFILLASGLFTVYFTGAFGMILTVWGVAGFLFGRRVFRRLLFPMFLLAFMIPLPLEMIADISVRMKLLATRASMGLLGMCGIMAVNDGSIIYMDSGAKLIVGYACSGLRSLIALIFLGVVFARLSNLTPPRRVLLFLSSIPIALVANIMRIFALSVIANRWGSRTIEGTIHDASGYLIFIVAFLLLYGMSILLDVGLRRPAGGVTVRPPDSGGDDPRLAAGVTAGLPGQGQHTSSAKREG